VREAATICPCLLQVDLILKVVSESRVTWATSVPILVNLGLSVVDLGSMYATDVRRASSLNAHRAGTHLRSPNLMHMMNMMKVYAGYTLLKLDGATILAVSICTANRTYDYNYDEAEMAIFIRSI